MTIGMSLTQLYRSLDWWSFCSHNLKSRRRSWHYKAIINLCQDPLELFFGCQRQRGGTSDNPNVLEFCQNSQALRVVDTFCRGPVRGNCRQKQDCHPIDKENIIPLLK